MNFNMVKRYVEAGLACHWLHGKAPYQKEWSTVPVATFWELKRSYQPGNNLGVRVGKWSVLQPEFGLIILDVDLRDPLGADACYAAVEGLLGHSTLSVASGRGIGGHIYLAFPIPDFSKYVC
jgi:Bifunctional DNA primase/polymerase, N-terminal